MAARRSPKPQAWVRFLLLLPGRVSQVERRLSAKQSIVGSIPTRASTVVSTGVRVGLISL